jgi:hypothetical protein
MFFSLELSGIESGVPPGSANPNQQCSVGSPITATDDTSRTRCLPSVVAADNSDAPSRNFLTTSSDFGKNCVDAALIR